MTKNIYIILNLENLIGVFKPLKFMYSFKGFLKSLSQTIN